MFVIVIGFLFIYFDLFYFIGDESRKYQCRLRSGHPQLSFASQIGGLLVPSINNLGHSRINMPFLTEIAFWFKRFLSRESNSSIVLNRGSELGLSFYKIKVSKFLLNKYIVLTIW